MNPRIIIRIIRITIVLLLLRCRCKCRCSGPVASSSIKYMYLGKYLAGI